MARQAARRARRARWSSSSRGGELAELAARVRTRCTCRCPDGSHAARRARRAAVPPLLVRSSASGCFPGAHAWLDAARRRSSPAPRRAASEVDGSEPGPRARPRRSAARCRSSTAAARSARWPPTAGSARSTRTPRRRRSGNAYPELDHNEICGWGQHGDVTRQVITLVELRHDFEHPQVGPALRRSPASSSTRSCTQVLDGRGRGRGRGWPSCSTSCRRRLRQPATWPPSRRRPRPDPRARPTSRTRLGPADRRRARRSDSASGSISPVGCRSAASP